MKKGGVEGFYFDLDTSEFEKQMALLTGENQKKFVRGALRSALMPMYNKTKKGAKLAYTSRSIKHKNGKAPEDGVIIRVSKYGDYSKVSLAGNPVLHLMELGTQDRKTKEEYNRGKMTKKLFFNRARDSEQNAILPRFETVLKKRIKKLWNS